MELVSIMLPICIKDFLKHELAQSFNAIAGVKRKDGVPHCDPGPDSLDGVHGGARQRPLLVAPHPHDHRLLPPDGSSNCYFLSRELASTGDRSKLALLNASLSLRSI